MVAEVVQVGTERHRGVHHHCERTDCIEECRLTVKAPVASVGDVLVAVEFVGADLDVCHGVIAGEVAGGTAFARGQAGRHRGHCDGLRAEDLVRGVGE